MGLRTAETVFQTWIHRLWLFLFCEIQQCSNLEVPAFEYQLCTLVYLLLPCAVLLAVLSPFVTVLRSYEISVQEIFFIIIIKIIDIIKNNIIKIISLKNIIKNDIIKDSIIKNNIKNCNIINNNNIIKNDDIFKIVSLKMIVNEIKKWYH